MNKKVLYILLIFISLFGITYGAYLYNGNGTVNIGTPSELTATSISFTPLSYSKTSNDYTNGKRQYFDTGTLNSEVYGDFGPDGRVDLLKNSGVNSNCDAGETVSYYFVGNFKHNNGGSDDWGKGYITESDPTSNYYCPDSGKFSIKLVSKEPETFFDTLIISNTTIPTYFTITVKDSKGNPITLDERVIFSNAKLQIGGVINTNSTIVEEFVGGTDNQKNASELLSINFDVSSGVGNLTQFITNIKKNINSQTRGKTWNSTAIGDINTLQTYMLYNFEGTETTNPSNVGNKGNIVKLNNSSNGLKVNGENTLIIKGGNLYIKDDIYSTSNTDILTIVVLRDETNKTNGGNVYIDPSVTNIDAIIVSEGSVLSYDGIQVIDSTTNANNLRNQLFIYGNLITRNTIGQNTSIYGTDDYILNGEQNNIYKYNLENLRSFQVVKTDQITSGPCMTIGKITAMGNTEIESINYAFAGKKECYFDDNTKNVIGGKLRSTHRTASTVIEYNSSIQINPPKIIKIYK